MVTHIDKDVSEQSMTFHNQESPQVAKPQVKSHSSTLSSKQKTRSQLGWFNNLPVRQKQFLGLFTSEIISVIGLMGVGSLLIILGGRSQLLQQAKAEEAVAQISYNLKIDQMGFGFRGQSDNQAIVRAVLLTANGQQLPPEERGLVQKILKNETTARNIEYATLVDRNGRIIVNANADRRGELFDPNGLVSRVLQNPQQIKASAIVSWDELQKEAPNLPTGFANSDALIRYTVTPVLNPANDDVLGALVSGDIVNNKLPIVENTLDAFDNGYSAVYMKNSAGDLVLATSLDLGEASDFSQAKVNVNLPDPSILNAAIESTDGTSSQRIQVGNQTYSASAKTITDSNNNPIGVIVRGTSEASLNALITRSLQVQLVIAILALGADMILATVLGRSIANPINQLQNSTKRFALGNRALRSNIQTKDEIGQLAKTFNELADKITQSEQKLMTEAQQQAIQAARSKFLADLAVQIRQSAAPQDINQLCVEGAREILQADRVLFFEFDEKWEGTMTAESVVEGWPAKLGDSIYDPCFEEKYVQQYREGRVQAVADIYQAGLTDCHLKILEPYKVRANLVVPVITGGHLQGLLIAHQCAYPRQWAEGDIFFLQQVGLQLGIALNQITLSEAQATQAVRAKFLANLALQIRQSMKDEDIMALCVEGTRDLLQTDRVLFFEFDDQWEGTMVAESVGEGWPVKLGDSIHDPCFSEKYVQQYREGRIQATTDIYQAGLTDCHLKILEPYKVQANLVVPVLTGESLKGLLIAHQCDAPRQWAKPDIDFLQQIATQLGYALNQAKLFNQKEWARLAAEDLSEQQRKQKESLQMQLIDLLSDVEDAASGNLTVRADVTAGDIGTVADFFNSIIENLRQVVIQVKQSTTLVNQSLGDNEISMRDLATTALQQAEETTNTLTSMEAMIQSIQIVAQQAQEAANVAHTASVTAETGEQAMDKTVNTIQSLRVTVGETAKKVKRLGEASQQISKVVSLINQIAMQTNLLAINAGIEAARAGEEGQGFAVVAEEVGELAARSSAATQEIEEIVTNIQMETYQVAEAMEIGTSQVVEGTQLVEKAKQSLGQIMAVSRQIDALVGSISEATVSQVNTSESVSTLMRQIASTSEQTSQSSMHVSSSLQETVAIAQKLQASVDTFTVEERSEQEVISH